MNDLEHAVYQSVRYGNLFDQPLTATQIWGALIVPTPESPRVRLHAGQRWGGQRAPHLSAVRAALASLIDQEVLGTKHGYYFLGGNEELVAKRQKKFWLAQDKWKVTQRVAAWLKLVPFVRMIAMSGSLSVGNTGPHSDLDLFVVVQRGRIWLARLLMLLTTQLLGRRRKHWNDEAPDKVCLNHYVTSDALTISSEIRNVYTAMLYHHLIPLYGFATYVQFQQANANWVKGQLMYVEAPFLPSIHSTPVGRLRRQAKRGLEQLLSEPMFEWLERAAETVQRAAIRKHTKQNQPGRVALSATELAFHPHTKVPALLNRFAQEEGQRQLV
ncbi:hypothetical protein CL628_03435 [bacterium]|nr:hypothetical protein [bacterium]